MTKDVKSKSFRADVNPKTRVLKVMNRDAMNEKENAAGIRSKWKTVTINGKNYSQAIEEVVAGKEEDVKKGFEISGISEHDIQV